MMAYVTTPQFGIADMSLRLRSLLLSEEMALSQKRPFTRVTVTARFHFFSEQWFDILKCTVYQDSLDLEGAP